MTNCETLSRDHVTPDIIMYGRQPHTDKPTFIGLCSDSEMAAKGNLTLKEIEAIYYFFLDYGDEIASPVAFQTVLKVALVQIVHSWREFANIKYFEYASENPDYFEESILSSYAYQDEACNECFNWEGFVMELQGEYYGLRLPSGRLAIFWR